MKLSRDARKRILRKETGGKGMILEPWPDPPGSGRRSIGAGHNFDPEEKPEYMGGISESKAWELFEKDIEWVEEAVNSRIDKELSQKQFDALGIATYNLGEPNTGSIYKAVNDGADLEDLKEIWKRHAFVQGEWSDGLANRRLKEFELYQEGTTGERPVIRYGDWADALQVDEESNLLGRFMQAIERFVEKSELNYLVIIAAIAAVTIFFIFLTINN